MNNELKYLTQLISSTLYSKPLPVVTQPLDWARLYHIIRKSGLVGFTHDSLSTVPELPDSIRQQLELRYMKATSVAVKQMYYSQLMLSSFEEAGIKCLPLKGMVLRNIYPNPVMRTMSDMDILIDLAKLEESRQLMKKLGFQVFRYDTHHDIYCIPPNINVELHKMLVVGELEDYFGIGFERATLCEGKKYTYQLSKEDFYIHMLGHMAYHFAHGGTGIRLVLDIRVYLDKYGDELDRAYIERELKKCGLDKFAQKAENLSEVWFKGAQSDEFIEKMGQLVLDSGYLGNSDFKETLEVVKQGNKTGARMKAVVVALFPPLKTMQFVYPALKKLPVLLPAAWVLRGLTVLFTRGENLARLSHLIQKDNSEIRQMEAMYAELGMLHLF